MSDDSAQPWESSVLEWLRATLPAGPAGETWLGDDAAVLVGPDGGWQLLACDTVVEGVHADLALTGLDDFGWKALVANLSDIAAMGGIPSHALVAVSAPPGTDVRLLYSGLLEATAEFSCPVVGGDLTSSSTLVVTVAVTGRCDSPPVLRSGASPGDGIWVTGPLGAAAAGLRLLRGGSSDQDALVRAHARPTPRLFEGIAARLAGATAMIDISDGLGLDLARLADDSGVGFRLVDVPVAQGATEEEAVGGGEDYELVFCAPDADLVANSFEGLREPIRIGSCSSRTEERLVAGRPLDSVGWLHSW